jgi:hypothetical protein
LLVVSEELAQSQYSTSQALTRWEYPLGDALPRYIEESLGGVFTHVDRSTSDRLYSGYDLIVHSELLGFTAEVPWTIFSQTKTRIEIEYRVIDVAMGDEFVIAAVGTEEVVTTHDRKSHAKDVEVAPTLPTVATSASIGQHIGVGVSFSPKWYHYLAAADAQLAISHCLTELQRKLVAELQ